MKFSVIAIVHNAAERIEEFVRHNLKYTDDVVIVDQGSTDNTGKIAEGSGARVFKRRHKGDSHPDRNWAFNLGKHAYVLYLDWDEVIQDDQYQRVLELVKSDIDIAFFKRRNFVDGKDISHLLGDDIQGRLFKSGSMRFPMTVHGVAEPAINTKVVYTDIVMDHIRTLDGLKRANRSRKHLCTEREWKMQEDFVQAVQEELKVQGNFNEDWYSNAQIKSLLEALQATKDLKGEIVEIGCWEGKSTVAITNKAYPQKVHAVDWWKGNIAEGPKHETIKILEQRNVFKTFTENMSEFTLGNYEVHNQDCKDFLNEFDKPVKFCHIDAAHDYASVKATIEALVPKLVQGGILCGDDFKTAHVDRKDLDGGVERAVKETLPGFESVENFWVWRKP